MKNDPKNLGSCCICSIAGKSVSNIITLDKRIPASETLGGWGCVVCDDES